MEMSKASSRVVEHFEAKSSEGAEPVVRQRQWNTEGLLAQWVPGMPAAGAILVVVIVLVYGLLDAPKASLLDTLSPPKDQNTSTDAVTRMQRQVEQLTQKFRQASNKVWWTQRKLKAAETAAGTAKQRAKELDEALGKERERTRKLTKVDEELREALQNLVKRVKEQAGAKPCTVAGNGSLCSALLEAKRRLLTECDAPLGSVPFKGTPEECSLAAEVLRTSLVRADRQYEENLKHRRRSFGGKLLTMRRIPPKLFRVALLLPLYPCPLEGRFGLFGDGGKWICMVHYNTSARPLVISVGSAGDASFEFDVSGRLHAFSHTFDFTLGPKQSKRMRSRRYLKFHNAGIAGKTEVASIKKRFQHLNPVILTLPEILHRIKARYVDILKVDCEGTHCTA